MGNAPNAGDFGRRYLIDAGFGPSSAPAAMLIAGRTAPAPDGAIVLYAGRREVARARTMGELSAALREHFGARAQLDGWYERAAILIPLPVGVVSAEVAA